MLPSLEEIVDNFVFLDDWDDKYRYLIELGRMLPPFPEEMRTEVNKVRGCASQVWLVSLRSPINDDLMFYGDSDAHIVRGLVTLALAIFSGKPALEIARIDAAPIFEQLGLASHLTPQRSNGLRAMVDRIKHDAQQMAMQATASVP